MFLPTHLAAGLIIGKLTGNYPVSVITSLAIDLDHLIAYYRVGILFNFKKIFKAAANKINIGLPQRNFFHNIFFCFLAIALAMTINFPAGLVFGLAYLCHLILDALDNSNYYPIYPNLKINLCGPIKTWSKQELIFALILLLIFFII